MATITKEEVLDAIANMTVLEVSELVKAMEEKFGVTAAAPVAGVAVAAPQAEEAAEEQTEFDVILTSLKDGANKIQVIKAVRTIVQGLGLKEAKELVDTEGSTVREGVSKEESAKIKSQLEEAGAVVELR